MTWTTQQSMELAPANHSLWAFEKDSLATRKGILGRLLDLKAWVWNVLGSNSRRVKMSSFDSEDEQ